MFRMKSNAFLLTVITTVSALAIGLLSLSYISFYSAEKNAENSIPNHFALMNPEDATTFKEELKQEAIAYNETKMDVIQVAADLSKVLDKDLDAMQFDLKNTEIPVVSEKDVQAVDVAADEMIFTGQSEVMEKFMSFKESGELTLKGKTETISQKFIDLEKETILPYIFTSGGFPVAVVDESVFAQLKNDIDPDIQIESTVYIGIDMNDHGNVQEADDIFQQLFTEETSNLSRLNMSNSQKQVMGLMMFIVGFLGLSFLITSGCILYFKQMDEAEDEKPNYTILRKLGFTQGELLKGIQIKQLFNFGIPLIIGLSHSYFAVKSGWFFFGTELWTPMLIVMVIYTVLYSIFGILSVLYYKKSH